MGSMFTQRVAEEVNSQPSPATSKPGNCRYLNVYLSHIEPDPLAGEATDTPQAVLRRLLDASRTALAAIEANTQIEPGALHRIRSQYARRFHPDSLPRQLYHIANEKMAEVNARIDAAIAAPSPIR